MLHDEGALLTIDVGTGETTETDVDDELRGWTEDGRVPDEAVDPSGVGAD